MSGGDADLPTLDNLRCFLAAAEHLNFRRGAAAVALTPTAFSQRIKQLEEQLGARLFARTTRSVRLTPAGVALVGEAQAALAQARRCVEVVHIDRPPPARFTVGTRFELGASWVVPCLLELEEQRPEWTTHVYFGTGPDIVDRLTVGEVDAIITSAPIARAGWSQHFLHVETYALVAAPALVEATPLRAAEDAAAHVLFDIDRRLPLARYLLDAPGPPLRFRDIRTLGAGEAMKQYVLAGRGVAVLPEYMIASELASGELVRLLEDLELPSDTFRLVHPADSPHAGVLEVLAGELKARPLR